MQHNMSGSIFVEIFAVYKFLQMDSKNKTTKISMYRYMVYIKDWATPFAEILATPLAQGETVIRLANSDCVLLADWQTQTV